MKNKTFVMGDIHGGLKSLMQCLERSSFDYENDTLISLGDISDGWPDVAECVDELMKIKHLVLIRGNHDQWLIDWMRDGSTPYVWISQGGLNTLKSYEKYPKATKDTHYEFLASSPAFYVDKKNRLFVHGGLKIGVPIKKQEPSFLMWDRDLVTPDANVPEYKEVYIGHSSVWRKSKTPLQYGNVTCMDTGGGWEGKLSMMNVDTKELVQSDVVSDLYPEDDNR